MSGVGISRNALCTCGSGQKYKECCGTLAADVTSEARYIETGLAQMTAGQPAEAIRNFRAALTLNPRSVSALEHLAAALLADQQIPDALRCYQRLVDLAPQSARAFNLFGNALFELGLFKESVQCYKRALELAPGLFESHIMMGNAHRATASTEEALACYRQALQLQPNSLTALVKIATTLRLMGQTSVAEEECRKALAAEPELAPMWAVLGEVLADDGGFDEAEQCFKTALSIDPALCDAWYGMAYVRKQSTSDMPLWAKAQKLADDEPNSQRELMLRYALGKCYDDTGDYPKAFWNYRRANDLSKSSRPPHDRAALARSTDEVIFTYTREWLNKHRQLDNGDDRPVFVVGMMRSGTSLVEQMLAAHSQVFGAGELGFWSNHFFKFNARGAGESVKASIRYIGGQHSKMLNAMSKDTLKIVDKTPINFLFLGLIHAVLPNARIIHMKRNPVDTCLSIYFQNFERTITYANDLEDLAHTYRQYRRVMTHWHDVLPKDVLLDVPYEDLVDDPEKWGRKIVEFVSLPWDDRLLNFHKVDRTVLTASKWQVRQKINKNSVERWRSYEEFISPLLSLIN